MYEEFYGLAEKPFSLTPNPHYAFYSEQYRGALQQLLYSIEQKEGFLLLTGMVGTGKTTLCREMLDQLGDDRHRTALIFNPFLNGLEMLQSLLTEFGCSYPPEASRKELLDRLNRFLLTQLVQGRTCVAIFDEAQHLSAEFLEQIRVLSNLETETEKLLQIVLVGQPELRERIQRPELAQLDQRVSLRCTLRTLSRDETERYVYHRLNVAGAQGRVHFSPAALSLLHRESGGVPRLINLISDRTLLAGFVARTTTLKPKQVKQALSALRGDPVERERPRALSRRRFGWLRGLS
ncbi:MAG TPA: AAA family ATPase [Longimicrobiaceae bacterium]|nr:AAA family ATPase [Longimicrobiaceae bacterium]